MTLQDYIKALVAFVPGSFAIWVNKWQGLFAGTDFSPLYPVGNPDTAAAALGTLAAAVLAVSTRQWTRPRLRRAAVISLIVAVCGFLAILIIRLALGYTNRNLTNLLYRSWELVYIISLVAAVCAVLWGIMTAQKNK